MTTLPPFDPDILPPGIRSRFVDGINGLRMHVLEAGFEDAGRPCVLLLHGFPELAYSWRKVILPLVQAGFHVIAPDQRGYGRTTGWDDRYDGNVASFGMLAVVRDALALVFAFGYHSVAAVVGHDFGSPVAAYCALIRPDVFRSVALMSAPFAGPPALPFGTAGQNEPIEQSMSTDIHQALAELERPRKHYQWYYATPHANADMQHCPQGVHAFLRAYYHHKSADWAGNKPFPLRAWAADELAKLPTYYVMDLHKNMAETVAAEMPSSDHIAACRWLPEVELQVYSREYERTGFQGGLHWYRCATDERYASELNLYAGRTIDVPVCFISGAQDWGNHQKPGALEEMRTSACTNMLGCHLIEGAGHWVQQEQPQEVSRLLLRFLSEARP
jgi:pimeloyl-ACP methyl ester carboxylesterase